MNRCPLCASESTPEFHADRVRSYRRCEDCRLIFVPPQYHLSPAEEKREYDLHENSPEDAGYRRFLSRLFDPVSAQLQPGSKGLDFGSGPGPTLSVMFEEVGHSVALYDPFYAPDTSVLSVAYDFVTASEVVEHLCRPGESIEQLWACVRPGGVLGIMTKLARDLSAFATWHYKDDRTHVSFFSRATFEWIADQRNADVTFVGADVILLSRRPRTG